MNELIRCAKCKNEELQQTKKARTRTVAGHTFQAELEVLSCPACGATYYSAQTVGEFEMAIAVWLAEQGVNDGEVVRLMRSVLKLKGLELAALLDVAPETLSRWEKEHRPPDRKATALLASMILDRKAGHDQTLQRLRSWQNPPEKASPVNLTLVPSAA